MTGPDRLAPFLARLDRLNLDDLGVIVLPEPDGVARSVLLERALAGAARAGPDRVAELSAVPRRVREHLLRAYNVRGLEPSWFGIIWNRSLGRADDRSHLIAAIEDAAIAAVADDLLPAGDLADLREPFEVAASMTGTAPSVNPLIESRRGRVFVALVGIASILVIGGDVILVPAATLIARLSQRRRRSA
jgi:hypothetical protein